MLPPLPAVGAKVVVYLLVRKKNSQGGYHTREIITYIEQHITLLLTFRFCDVVLYTPFGTGLYILRLQHPEKSGQENILNAP